MAGETEEMKITSSTASLSLPEFWELLISIPPDRKNPDGNMDENELEVLQDKMISHR